MIKINKLVLLINNQPERISLYRLTQNFILRILSQVWWNFETKDVISKSTKWEALWKIEYWKEIFMEHLKSYIDKFYPYWLNKKQDEIKYVIKNLYDDLLKTKTNGEFINILYAFIQDPFIVDFLNKNNLSTSILIEENEYKASSFQKSMFNYVNKSQKQKNLD